jgi:NADH-quinone oxidoreductase subunit A
MSVIDRPGFGQNESGEPGATSWTPVPMSSEQEREMLERSISGLRQAAPRMSADHVVSTGQKLGLVVAGLLVVAVALFDPILMMQIAIGVATVVYSAAVIYRVVLVKAGLAGTDLVRVTDEEARAIADADLPVYTVLVPAYREPEVIATVIESMAAIDYPADKLDVRLLLEEDDVETIRVARRTVEGSPVRIVLVPAAEPRTKPKACNYGLQSARGEFVTIYDAGPKPQEKATPMTGILQNYLPLVVFIGVASLIGLALLIAPFLVAFQQPDPEKLSAYECGFNAFDDARMKFDVRFYLVAILFIIFDLEVAFLFPWAVAYGKLGVTGFWTMMVFLTVLTIGFVYEWKKGALEWD